jgi:hypothetical protein
MRVRATIDLPVGPEEAWRCLLDWERQPAWMRDADRVRVLTPHRQGSGVRIAVRTRVLGIPLLVDVLEVVAWDPPRRLVLAHTRLVRGSGEWRLEPLGSRTRFVWTERLSVPIPVLGELALLAYRPFMRWLMRRSLAALQKGFQRN